MYNLSRNEHISTVPGIKYEKLERDFYFRSSVLQQPSDFGWFVFFKTYMRF